MNILRRVYHSICCLETNAVTRLEIFGTDHESHQPRPIATASSEEPNHDPGSFSSNDAISVPGTDVLGTTLIGACIPVSNYRIVYSTTIY